MKPSAAMIEALQKARRDERSEPPPRRSWQYSDLTDTFGKCEFEEVAAALLTECGWTGRWDAAIARSRLRVGAYRIDQMIERGWLVAVDGTPTVRATDAFYERLREKRILS